MFNRRDGSSGVVVSKQHIDLGSDYNLARAMLRRPQLCISCGLMVMVLFTLWQVPLTGQEKKSARAIKHLELDLDGSGVKMKFAYIEAGKFMMGSPKSEDGRFDDELQHEVEITKPFWMGVFEVTQEEYEKVTGKNPSKFKGPRLPVEMVSWEDALEFCKKLSKKKGKTFDLPTEAEWEYACRAGSTGPVHYGNSLSSRQANFDGLRPYGEEKKGKCLEKTAPVGSYSPNAFGLYDMHGNVLEWCKDWRKTDYYVESPRQDPQGPATGEEKVLRGGSWTDDGRHCRSAYRSYGAPFQFFSFTGFRIVMRVP